MYHVPTSHGKNTEKVFGRGKETTNCANFANVAALPLVVGHLMRKENWRERERRNLSGQGALGMGPSTPLRVLGGEVPAS